MLLVLVLVPFIGKGVNGARRWIPLGLMNFQPSELAKLAMALYAASYMVRKMDTRENFFHAVTPMAIALGFVGILLLAEPDMGAFMVIAAIALGILFLGGVNGRMFALVVARADRRLRADDRAEPVARRAHLCLPRPLEPGLCAEQGLPVDAFADRLRPRRDLRPGAGRRRSRSCTTCRRRTPISCSRWSARNSASSACFAVVAAFFWLTRRIFHIGRQAVALDRVFAGLLAQGIGIWIGGQAFINMGVNLGVLPTKGLTLPLMSYGGSAILMNLVSLAIVVRIDIENRSLMRGGRVMNAVLLVCRVGAGGAPAGSHFLSAGPERK